MPLAVDPCSDAHHRRLFEQASRLVGFGAWECDTATEDLTWTEGVFDIFELPRDIRPRREAILDLYSEDSRRDLETLRAEALRTGRGFALDAKITTYRGNERWMRVTLDVACEDGRVVRTFGAKQNITSQREAWTRLRQLAEHDPLTGLANRGLFERHYREVVGDDLHRGYVSALALIDVDHFKTINDRFGHAAGDECLRQVAARLNRIFAGAVLIARIGGDEFGILLSDRLTPVRVVRALQRAVRLLGRPIVCNGQRIDVTVSIGARILGQPPAGSAAGLFHEADEALYAAKAAGRDRAFVFGSRLLVEPPAILLDTLVA